MIKSVNYKLIPNTNIELGAEGEKNSRTLIFRTTSKTDPLHIGTSPRAIYIGRPQREIRQAMRDGRLTRSILKDMGFSIGGGTFTGLQKALDTYLKDNLG